MIHLNIQIMLISNLNRLRKSNDIINSNLHNNNLILHDLKYDSRVPPDHYLSHLASRPCGADSVLGVEDRAVRWAAAPQRHAPWGS